MAQVKAQADAVKMQADALENQATKASSAPKKHVAQAGAGMKLDMHA